MRISVKSWISVSNYWYLRGYLRLPTRISVSKIIHAGVGVLVQISLPPRISVRIRTDIRAKTVTRTVRSRPLPLGQLSTSFDSTLPCTVGHKSHDPWFHVFLVERRVMTFVAHCTQSKNTQLKEIYNGFNIPLQTWNRLSSDRQPFLPFLSPALNCSEV